MRRFIVVLLAAAGLAPTARGQQAILRMLVSTDGVNFSNSVNAAPGSHVDVLATVSYTGASTVIAGLGFAIFQPTISNWRDGALPDQLRPLLQGGNQIGALVNAQAAALGVGSPNPYLTPTPGVNGGPAVPAAPYSAGTYGRVYPMGGTYLDGPNAITSFVHHNPDNSGLTYLRIGQGVIPEWFNPVTNFTGGSGVNCSQRYVLGRTTLDPDFWGNRDVTYDAGSNAFTETSRIPAHDNRLQNIQVFRFGIDLSSDGTGRSLTVDAPLAGQQRDPVSGNRFISFYASPSDASPSAKFFFETGQASIQTAVIHVPAPGALSTTMCLLALRRRRRGWA